MPHPSYCIGWGSSYPLACIFPNHVLFDTGQPSLCESIDHTGIAEGFIAYTSYDHEVLFNPGNRDEEYTKFLDFQEENYFDLHREDYDNDEDEAPLLRT